MLAIPLLPKYRRIITQSMKYTVAGNDAYGAYVVMGKCLLYVKKKGPKIKINELTH